MSLTATDVLDRSETLAIALAGRANEAEAIRRLPPATMTDLEDLDLLRMVVPSSLGGHGLGFSTLAHSTRLLGHGCTASAWTISFLVMHNFMLAKFPAAARSELFPAERPWALVPAPLAPTGTAVAVDGGYRVSGRWEWATGVHHSDWIMVHTIQMEPEIASRFVLVPTAEATIDDVWYTSGMCATGSDTVRLDDVFVPEHRAVRGTDLMLGGEVGGAIASYFAGYIHDYAGEYTIAIYFAGLLGLFAATLTFAMTAPSRRTPPALAPSAA